MGINLSKFEDDRRQHINNKRRVEMDSEYNTHVVSFLVVKSASEAADQGLCTVSGKSGKTGNLPRVKESFDDVLSRSTESTTGSPDLADLFPEKMALKKGPAHTDTGCLPIPTHTKTTPLLALARPGNWFSRPQNGTSNKNLQAVTPFNEAYDSLPPPLPINAGIRKSENCTQKWRQTSSSLPVKCPPRRQSRNRRITQGSMPKDSASYNDSEENDHLQHLYDMRTWDMYLRITEARKKQTPATIVPHRQGFQPSMVPKGYDVSRLPPSRVEASSYFGHFVEENEPSLIPPDDFGHEMIFGELE